MRTPDPERYLAVLKACYDYDPQSSDEIAIKEDQLLFLVERTDDDWWKVKVKGDSQEADTPIGLVPMAYVEQAKHKYLVKALYDYEAAAPGELTISEDEILLSFELDEEWLLVQSQQENGGAGYVPGNYVEETTGEEPPPESKIIIPPSKPRPVSTYADPADRVAASKVTADDIKTWSVLEVDKKSKKKKGTLGIGNGSAFFASESDKTPVQKWLTGDIVNISNEKPKHVGVEIGGTNPASLLFNVGKDNVEMIMKKLESSRELARSLTHDLPEPNGSRFVASAPSKGAEKGTVRFSPASPTIIPSREEDEEEDEEEEEKEENYRAPNGHVEASQTGRRELAIALYDFTADGKDELSVAENEEVIIIERDGDEWWKCRNARGVEGVVPASYLEFKVSSSSAVSRMHPLPEEESENDSDAEAKKAAQEVANREEAERLQREEKERLARERKKQEAQGRAREAAVAEAERQKRREAAAAAAKKSPSPSNRSESRNNASSSIRKSQEVTFPPAEHVRTWHDRTGQFRVDAAFLGFSNGKLRLHKINGVIVEVPSEKMSHDDIRFVEKLTRKSRKPGAGQLKHSSDDDIPLATLQNSISTPPKSQTPISSAQMQKSKGPRIDWFDFFLSAGCDIDDCTRYASAFERDKIDETLLPDITDSTMRSLGLREGDIIRIRKAIEKRRPGENMEKQSAYIKEQLKQDENLARQLQAQETDGSSARTPAPNLFAGAGGALKNPRRGRRETVKTLPINVDIGALSSASEQINRTASPQAISPATRPESTPVQPTKTNFAPAVASSGFDDDAWAPRPSSTKPTITTIAASSATPAPVSVPSPPVSSTPPTAATATAPAPTPVPSVPPAPTSGTPTKGLAQTTQSDIFDQLARLSQLRVTPQPLIQPHPQPQTGNPTVIPPPSFSAGLGMGSSPVSLGQALSVHQSGLLQASSQPPQQSFNDPRGPFAPVPANQSLLQPLIPTQTGFNSFVPTRANSSHLSASSLPFQNQQNQFNPTSSFMAPQPTGLSFQQRPMSQSTGIPGVGLPPSSFGSESMMNTSPFGSGSTFQLNPGLFNPSPSPVTVQPTGVFAQSPFNNSVSSPSIPPNSNSNSTAPANVFASMKLGTFGKDEDISAPQSADKYNVLRPNLGPQPAGWGGYNGYSGF